MELKNKGFFLVFLIFIYIFANILLKIISLKKKVKTNNEKY